MDKITALKLALDGKKVTYSDWGKREYIWYCPVNGYFYNQDGYTKNINNSPNDNNWYEYIPDPKFKVGDIVFVKGKFGKVVDIDADGEYSISFDKDYFPDITDIKESELEPA